MVKQAQQICDIHRLTYPCIAVLMQIQGTFSGSLSSEIGRLVELRTLAILDTMIKGSIPSELGKLTHLGMSRECIPFFMLYFSRTKSNLL